VNFLEIVNNIISTTGVGKKITTVENLNPDSDEELIVGFTRDAQTDLSRDVPQAPLFFNGNISTIDDEDISDSFPDEDGDTVGDSSMQLTTATATVTGTATALLTVNANWPGRLFHVVGDSQWYRMLSVTAASPGTITLAGMDGKQINYRGATDSVAGGQQTVDGEGKQAKIGQDRYLLPKNFKRPISVNDFFGQGRLEYLRTEDYDVRIFDAANGSRTFAKPEVFTIFSTVLDDGSPRYYIEFDPIPDDIYHYHFRYEGSPSLMETDDDVPGYPPEYEAALIFRGRYYVYRYIKKQLDDAQFELGEYTKIVNDQRKTDVANNSHVQLQPQTARAHFARAYDGD
jgi:hypothetical protein